jgi:hypothetical protein
MDREIIKKFVVKFFDSIVKETNSYVVISEKSILEFFEEYKDDKYREYIPFFDSFYVRKMLYEFIRHHQDILKIYGINIINNSHKYAISYNGKEIIFRNFE